MPGPHHRRREYAGPGAVAEALLNPAWSHLEPPPVSKRSDWRPRTTRRDTGGANGEAPGPPGGAAAARPWRWRGFRAEVWGTPPSRRSPRRQCCSGRPLTIADTFAGLEAGAPGIDDVEQSPRPGRRRRPAGARWRCGAFAASRTFERHVDRHGLRAEPVQRRGSTPSRRTCARRARRDARVRRAKKGEADRSVAAAALRGEENGTNPPNVDSEFVIEKIDETDERSFETTGGKEATSEKGVYVARIAAHVSRLNHSCDPNAAVSAGDGVTTVYSRAPSRRARRSACRTPAISWLPVRARAQLAALGFLCACARCGEGLARRRERERRGRGPRAGVAFRRAARGRRRQPRSAR